LRTSGSSNHSPTLMATRASRKSTSIMMRAVVDSPWSQGDAPLSQSSSRYLNAGLLTPCATTSIPPTELNTSPMLLKVNDSRSGVESSSRPSKPLASCNDSPLTRAMPTWAMCSNDVGCLVISNTIRFLNPGSRERAPVALKSGKALMSSKQSWHSFNKAGRLRSAERLLQTHSERPSAPHWQPCLCLVITGAKSPTLPSSNNSFRACAYSSGWRAARDDRSPVRISSDSGFSSRRGRVEFVRSEAAVRS